MQKSNAKIVLNQRLDILKASLQDWERSRLKFKKKILKFSFRGVFQHFLKLSSCFFNWAAFTLSSSSILLVYVRKYTTREFDRKLFEKLILGDLSAIESANTISYRDGFIKKRRNDVSKLISLWNRLFLYKREKIRRHHSEFEQSNSFREILK